jgi:glycosyltransferase involved in cell wall biosynthesis
MTSPLRISAVIPCHNGAAFLEEAIRSVRAQTRAVHELIVVDDASMDDSAEIAERLGARVLRMPSNVGPSASRNRGVREARGDVIAFLDADDYWMPEHCEKVVGLLERHEDCAVAFGRRRSVGTRDGAPASPISLADDEPSWVLWRLIRENIITQSAAVVRRAALQRHGGYDESRRYSEDYELWLRLASTAPFVCTSSITVSYRLHPHQVSRDGARMVQGEWDVRYKLWREAVRNETTEFVARLESLLTSIWNTTLSDAWWSRNEDFFIAALSLHELIPNGTATYRRWLRRYRLSWGGWVILSKTWDRLPRPTKEFAKPRLRAMLAPRASHL